MSKVCTKCNTENVVEAKFCRACGTSSFQMQDNIDEVNDTYEKSNTNIDNKAPKIIEEEILDSKKIEDTYNVHPDYIHYRAFMKEMFEKYGF